MGFVLLLICLLVVAAYLLFLGLHRLAWLVPATTGFIAWALNEPTLWWFWTVLSACAVGTILMTVPLLRRPLISSRVMKILASVLPTISETEKVALEAGTVWWDAEFFKGQPDFKKILEYRPQGLSTREQEFLEGPVEELCRMCDDFQIRKDGDMPPEIWEFIKENRFWGMIIPQKFGGLGFSALMHSAVITKLSSRCVAASVTVMVPNSLGPAELLLHYGTDEQKQHYLPRLASGEEVPCFALTEPTAGSDAASIAAEGVVCRGEWKGETVLGLRLNWSKRYITLGPVSTVLGLAFQMKDPEHLVGSADDVGITCALIPPDLPGVIIGQRHDPLGIPFQNGPNEGHDVFVPLDCIIGGRDGAGQGWKMLMQCLAAGRSISLPSLSTGAAQLTSRTISAYASVREQFNVRIGMFEGVEERIGRVAGLTYIMNAARTLTASAVDAGEKPAVVSAIVKAYLTEMMRVVVNDGMDIQGGAGICDGPRNILASPYMSVPIGITVEGANILTRCLIIYGQGALRCHPYVRGQVEAVEGRDVKAFDRAFFGHVAFTAVNVVRSTVHALTRGTLSKSPVHGAAEPYFRWLNRYSSAFVVLSDASMAILGGALKRKEMLSGRLADALGWMYLSTCTLKTFVDRGQRTEEEPLLVWACEHGMYEVQQALRGVIDNFPNRLVAMNLSWMLFPPGSLVKPPTDRQTQKAARALLENVGIRELLTRDIFSPAADDPGLGAIEKAYQMSLEVAPVNARMKDAIKSGKLDKLRGEKLTAQAVEREVITAAEKDAVETARAACLEVIQVDSFGPIRAEATSNAK